MTDLVVIAEPKRGCFSLLHPRVTASLVFGLTAFFLTLPLWLVFPLVPIAISVVFATTSAVIAGAIYGKRFVPTHHAISNKLRMSDPAFLEGAFVTMVAQGIFTVLMTALIETTFRPFNLIDLFMTAISLGAANIFVSWVTIPFGGTAGVLLGRLQTRACTPRTAKVLGCRTHAVIPQSEVTPDHE